MNTTTQTTEQQALDVLKQQVVERIKKHHPQLDITDRTALLQAVYDVYDENDVLHELYDELVANMQQLTEQKAEKEKVYDENLDRTIAIIEQMKQTEGTDTEAVEQAVAWLQRVADEVAHGTLVAADILLVMKGTSYDADLAAADHEGEVRGRNFVIDNHLRTRKASGDVPALMGTGGISSMPHSALLPLGALASTARPTIWERGRERRY